jgi:GNAT superfamily N-acetyltransferase
MNYRFATPDDAGRLAGMNGRLVQDEGHRNRMTLDELRDRMVRWLATEYQAVMFEDNADAVGYALFKSDPDCVYLRQFFVERSRRRQGVGQHAIAWLLANVWRDAARVRLEVLVANSAAIAFWTSLGFTDYCITMERGLIAPS